MRGPDRPEFSASPSTSSQTQSAPSAEQLLAVRQFVARVGGFENARQALDMLTIVSLKSSSR